MGSYVGPVDQNPMAAAIPLKLRVEGMDCGACAVKIENVMKRLPGVSDIDVNYGLQSLSLVVDEDRTQKPFSKNDIIAVPEQLLCKPPLQTLDLRLPVSS
jgi:copper chaperone CopZ